MSETLRNMRKEFEEDYMENGQVYLIDAEGNTTKLTAKQIGGDHYAKHKIQPWDIIDDWGLDYYLGNVIKYVLRDKHDQIEDLQKAIHYLEKKIELLKGQENE